VAAASTAISATIADTVTAMTAVSESPGKNTFASATATTRSMG
jgi:hypothetical protein